MTPEEAIKNLNELAETLITPTFLRDLTILGGILIVFGIISIALHWEVIIAGLFVITGFSLIGIVWYVKDNFEWK